MWFHAVLLGSGALRWQPLIAHLATTKWRSVSQVSLKATVADSCEGMVAAALVFGLWGACRDDVVEVAVSV
jgi:hypothetical protein